MESHKPKKIVGSIGSILMNEVMPTKRKTLIVGNPSFEDQIQTLEKARVDLEESKQASIDSELKNSRQKGYAAGLASGMADGLVQANKENSENALRINNIISVFSELIEDQANSVESIIIDAVAIALKNSYLLEVSINRDHVSSIVKAGLINLPSYASNISIRCSREDVDYLKLDELNTPVVIDEGLSIGEIEIDSDSGLLRLTGDSIAKKVVHSFLNDNAQ